MFTKHSLYFMFKKANEADNDLLCRRVEAVKVFFQLVTFFKPYFLYSSLAIFFSQPLFVFFASWHSDSASAGTGGNLGFEKGTGTESCTSCILMKNMYSVLQVAPRRILLKC